MIEINLLKQGHGILYKQKYVEFNVACRRTKILLLLILLLSSFAVYFTPAKPLKLDTSVMTKLFGHLDTIWFEESSSPFKTWLEENVLFLKDKISIQQLKGLASGIVEGIFPKKESDKEEIFYVRVASSLQPEEIDSIQKNLLAKGFQSEQGTYKKLVDKFFVIINPSQTQDNVDSILSKTNTPDVNWEIQISEDEGPEIISQLFSSLKEAEHLKELIVKEGFKGKVTKTNVPLVFHEVRTGKFKNRAEAVSLLNQLQKAGMEGTIVKK